jgi:DNA-binding ferritin-like protein
MEDCLKKSISLLCEIGTTSSEHILRYEPSNPKFIQLHEKTQQIAQAVECFDDWQEIARTLTSIQGYTDMSMNEKLTTILKLTDAFDDYSINILLKVVADHTDLGNNLEIIMKTIDCVFEKLNNQVI